MGISSQKTEYKGEMISPGLTVRVEDSGLYVGGVLVGETGV